MSPGAGAGAVVTDALENLAPRPVWRAFAALCAIPRPSGRVAAVQAHLAAWADVRGLAWRRDEAGNLVVRVPARGAGAHAAPVVLQAHVDMVAEQRSGVEHDWSSDAIRPERDGEWVAARDTTLGADNGIGVALMQAIVEQPPAVHPPLELLFTVDEEVGLVGAAALDPDLVAGRRLVNLDGEEDGVLYVGCAGALGLSIRLPIRRRPRGGERWRVVVDGLRGGHSGVDIHRPHGQALQLLAGLLDGAFGAGLAAALVSFDGGDKGNAIARRAVADLRIAAKRGAVFARHLAARGSALAARYRDAEPGLRVDARPITAEDGGDDGLAAVAAADRDRLLRFLRAVPHGVRAVSPTVPGAVETSVNLASIRTRADAAQIAIGIRSADERALTEVAEAIEALADLAGGEVGRLGSYPPWPPAPEAPLVRRAAAVHGRLFGERPRLESVHAGLECGVLARRLPGLEAVSFGPWIVGAHAPGERVRIASVERADRLLRALLEALADAADAAGRRPHPQV